MRSAVFSTLVVALALGTAGPAAGNGNPVPNAAQVTVRGKRALVDALGVALGPVTGPAERTAPAPSGSVLFILDVTPYTAAAEDDLAGALIALDEKVKPGGRWRVARLGEKPGRYVDRPGQLAPVLSALLAEDTQVRATPPALLETIRALPEPGANVVYLADWHFEDDVELEKLVTLLRKKGHTFHVVGSEACFGRAWIDGFYPPDRLAKLPSGKSKLYADGVGRSPFGPEDEDAPWHGGDSAWPHLPFRWHGTHWVTEFPVELPKPPARKRAKERYARPKETDERRSAEGTPEDLQGRQQEEHAADTQDRYWFPLPSGFGSYPLMRAAGMTGGRYILWSWNPSGRSDLEYDYGRCNHFAPDLRPRRVIHDDVRRRPLAMAILYVWHLISNDKFGVAHTTAPLAADGRRPLEMTEARYEYFLDMSWDTEREWRVFLVVAKKHLVVLQKAIARLDDVLKTPSQDDVDRRYEADARLLRHTLAVKRFQLLEALAAAKGLDAKTAWEKLPLHPTLDPRTWIPEERDPELVIPTEENVFHPTEGEALLEDHRRHLERFAKTPYGEIAARNRVNTYRVIWLGYASGQPTKRSPAESDATRPTTPPSGGGGPVTGR